MILVEGNIDVVSLHQYGFDNAIASLGTSLTEEHATLLSRYTEEVVLTYDSDEAGQRAAQRAIPMLEKVGIKVKVLNMKDAKDPDEFLQKFGADRFKMLLEDSSNRVEYQLNAIRKKYNIAEDDQRIAFIHEAAELISTLASAVQREVYGSRVAEAGKISLDAMKLEINKAYKRRAARDKKRQEKIDLEPVKALQPKARSIRYDNMKSAMAEESVIALVLREPGLMDGCALTGAKFSVPLLGKVYDQLLDRHKKGLEVGLGALADLSDEEMSHVAGISQRQQGVVNENAFRDCVNTIARVSQTKNVESDDDLLKIRNKLKESKGTRQ